MKTTLNQIREHNPCTDGWKKLLAHLGKSKADDEPLSILTILESNGLDDALWCLRAVEGFEREKRLYAVRCARRVSHLMTDQRSLDALDVAERFANNEATQDELDAAWAAAGAAAGDATGDVAWAASWATGDAAWGAERGARGAERDAAGDAAWGAARGAQEKDLRELLEGLA